jgi:serine/threonine protein kinase
MSARSDALALVGTVIDGRYRIEAVVGEGGHGVVYRALHLALDLRLALKVLRRPGNSDITAGAQTVLHDIRTEARVLFKMCSLHPSFVQAKDTGRLITARGDIASYLVMEWLEGVSLAQQIRACGERRWSLGEVIQLLDAPSRGLAMAHAHGIVHRDLKPGNLFVANCDGVSTAKVLDFGLAKVQSCGAGTTSNLGDYRDEPRSFTPAYAAPEQWLQRLGATGTWTDVHAWALLCSELLSGQAPFKGDCDEQLMAACLDRWHRPTPRALGGQVSWEVERVFLRALAIEPRQRFRDIGEFWNALCAAASGSGPADLGRASVSTKSRGLERDTADSLGRTELPREERTNPTWASPMVAPRYSSGGGKSIRSMAIAATLLFPSSQTSITEPTPAVIPAAPTRDIPDAPARAHLESHDEPPARAKPSADAFTTPPNRTRNVKGREAAMRGPSASPLSRERSLPPDEPSDPDREGSEDHPVAAPAAPIAPIAPVAPVATAEDDVNRLFNSDSLSIRN